MLIPCTEEQCLKGEKLFPKLKIKLGFYFDFILNVNYRKGFKL